MALEFTTTNFDTEVIKSSKPVLVDFWAEWCGPCRMIGPIVEDLGKELEGQLKVGKLNVDQEPAIAQKYGIRNIPTLLVFKNGEVADKIVGAIPKPMLLKKIQPHLDN
ncbi:MAG: thioredoxin [Bacteroidetes bacterium]|nr:thioredoxin [Bacteroidota bacterium]